MEAANMTNTTIPHGSPKNKQDEPCPNIAEDVSADTEQKAPEHTQPDLQIDQTQPPPPNSSNMTIFDVPSEGIRDLIFNCFNPRQDGLTRKVIYSKLSAVFGFDPAEWKQHRKEEIKKYIVEAQEAEEVEDCPTEATSSGNKSRKRRRDDDATALAARANKRQRVEPVSSIENGLEFLYSADLYHLVPALTQHGMTFDTLVHGSSKDIRDICAQLDISACDRVKLLKAIRETVGSAQSVPSVDMEEKDGLEEMDKILRDYRSGLQQIRTLERIELNHASQMVEIDQCVEEMVQRVKELGERLKLRIQEEKTQRIDSLMREMDAVESFADESESAVVVLTDKLRQACSQ